MNEIGVALKTEAAQLENAVRREGVAVRRGVGGQPAAGAGEWCLGALAGRVVEMAGAATTAALSVTAALVLESQRGKEPVVWVANRTSTFYPPDFAETGIDLSALPVVHAEGVAQGARVVETLLRSGGFGVVVFDLGHEAEIPLVMQARFAGLTRKHHTALVCLTRKEPGVASLGSLVSVRGETWKSRAAFDRFLCEVQVVKNKGRGVGQGYREVCRGPAGLC